MFPAGVTQLVECNLAKVDVAGSNPVSRSTNSEITLVDDLGLLAGGAGESSPRTCFPATVYAYT